MKRLLIVAAVMLSASPAIAQEIEYPQNGRVVRAELAAKAAAASCERELKAGKSGPACARYHAAVLDALGRESSRLQWCSARSSETSTFKVTASCLTGQADMRIGPVMNLERKVDPKAWKKFDDDMARFAPR